MSLILSTLALLALVSCTLAASGTCAQDPYKDLLFLSAFPPAQAYCSVFYPVHTTVQTSFVARAFELEERGITETSRSTTTRRTTSTSPRTTTTSHRTSTSTTSHRTSTTTPHQTSTTTTRRSTTTTLPPHHSTTTSTTSRPVINSCTGACSAWSSCSKKGGAFLSTLCSCIETPKAGTRVSQCSRMMLQVLICSDDECYTAHS
jgi:hypothetical protein